MTGGQIHTVVQFELTDPVTLLRLLITVVHFSLDSPALLELELSQDAAFHASATSILPENQKLLFLTRLLLAYCLEASHQQDSLLMVLFCRRSGLAKITSPSLAKAPQENALTTTEPRGGRPAPVSLGRTHSQKGVTTTPGGPPGLDELGKLKLQFSKSKSRSSKLRSSTVA